MTRNKIRWIWPVCVLLISVISCNFPALNSQKSDQVSIANLRQTLAATGPSATLSANITGEATDIPEELGTPIFRPTQPPTPLPGENYIYITRSGDTPAALSARFDVGLEQIPISTDQPWEAFLDPGIRYVFPNNFSEVSPPELLLPDSEIIYSPSAVDFDLDTYIQQSGGHLSSYIEKVNGVELNGAQIIQKVADELSVNPRLLLAILEFRAGWVFGQPPEPKLLQNPIGFYVPERSGLYQEIQITATQLNVAYYGWRQGEFTEIKYQDGRTLRLNPILNPGTVALQHIFAILLREPTWQDALFGSGGFTQLYQQMFGDPWERDAAVGPLFPSGLTQPPLELPFSPGERWSLTAGPHPAWNSGTPRAALDLSPVTSEPVCAVSNAWVTASAPGNIVRAVDNAVVLDLDNDGYEQTGWTILYYHLANSSIIPSGKQVETDFPLGHPSCEGGRATGKHVHIARKYNGEWLAADGPLPFILSGWRAQADERNYYGSLIKGEQTVSANPSGTRTSIIVREK